MVLTNLILAAILVLMIGAIAFGLIRVIQTHLHYRGQRQQAAAVHVDALKAARGRTGLKKCSRWPEKRNCGQVCLSQIQADPEDCLVWNMVATSYRGKTCAYCQKPFLEIHWHDRHPMVLSPERIAKQWNEIPAKKLPEVFETHLPVCWNGYIAEMFRQQNACRALDRKWERRGRRVHSEGRGCRGEKAREAT